MERHRGISPCGSAPFPGKNLSQHLRNGALRGEKLSEAKEGYAEWQLLEVKEESGETNDSRRGDRLPLTKLPIEKSQINCVMCRRDPLLSPQRKK